MLVTVHSRKITPCQAWMVPKVTGWNWIIQNWHTLEWTSIPEDVRKELHLHPALGVCSGMLLTKASAQGLNELTRKLNKIGEIK